ncbi:MAG: ATP synthase F1 subunit gamma [Lachnospiraceae bacterium]|nr:ATP synthase F1 subunit gamma [Lachnospiraceae bacterium]MDE6698658.1 ATP synthase F1 subunit gamma [Lachnospiraceae bacterium]
MASMRDIQRRKTSVESTGQITKAMKLVSTVKLQKARGRAESSKPYFEGVYDTMAAVLARSGNVNHRFLKNHPDKKKAVIVITSNRGLAGGYNSNVVKLLTQNDEFAKENVVLYTVGRKGKDALSSKGYEVKADYSDVIDNPLYSDAMSISDELLKSFEAGEIGEIYLAYTVFKNTVSHIPTMKKLLPISVDEYELSDEEKLVPMNYEPGEEEVLDMIIPKYISSLIFGALVEAVASENGARMTAMDSATSNANEMISSLSLLYNRARQSSITQELTEIIAGAEAIN